MSYQYRISQPCTEWAIGQQWTFARFTRRVWEDFAKFARALLPDPVAIAIANVKQATEVDAETLRDIRTADAKEMSAAKIEKRKPQLLAAQFRGLSDAIADKALAKGTSYLSAQSPELSALLNSHEGGAYLFWLLLNPKRHDDPPVIAVTEDEAYDVYWDLWSNDGADGRKTIPQIISVCNGTAPECVKNGSPPAA